MKIAVGQFVVSKDKEDNLNQIEKFVVQAKSSGADLIVFPEGSMRQSGATLEELASDAEFIDGNFVSKLKEVAQRKSISICAGFFEKKRGEARVYNTVVAIAADGTISGAYRKVHLYDAFGTKESDRMLSGDGETIQFECAGLKVAPIICYDLRFPEIARYLSRKGAQVILVCAAWYDGVHKAMHLETLLRARAIENGVWVVASCQCGPPFVGLSMVVSPSGVIVKQARTDAHLIVHDLDSHSVQSAQDVSQTLANARPDIYKTWLN
jgi:deaminated glutathione amidase